MASSMLAFNETEGPSQEVGLPKLDRIPRANNGCGSGYSKDGRRWQEMLWKSAPVLSPG